MEKFRNTKQAPISTSNMSIERARQAESNAAKILIGRNFGPSYKGSKPITQFNNPKHYKERET